MLGVYVMFLAGISACSTERKASLFIETSSPTHITHPWYLSLGMDSNLIRRRWESFDFSSEKLLTLAKGLAPAYLRLMGTDGDRMMFEDKSFQDYCTSQEDCPYVPLWVPGHWDSHFQTTTFTMYSDDWDKINTFTASVGWRLLFGINSQLRSGGQWDSSNTIELLEYTIKKGYASNVDFQLGNEPDIYPLFNFTVITAKQLAEDFRKLRDLLSIRYEAHFKNADISGPDLAMGQSTEYLSEFLAALDDEVDLQAVTFHQYYGGSEINHLDNFTDPNILDTYIPIVDGMKHAVQKSRHPELPVWQGETSSSYAPPGDSPICESYAAGFMLLDKLGVSASHGLDLVVRQTFYGFWFALVGQDLLPRPNYWTALLFKQLVGSKVLNVDVHVKDNVPKSVRAYAHCAKVDELRGTHSGAVVIYIMNLFREEVSVSIEGTLKGIPVDEYLLTPEDNDPLSLQIRLNDKQIKMTGERSLPELLPRRVQGNAIKLPALSYAYYVLPGAGANACL